MKRRIGLLVGVGLMVCLGVALVLVGIGLIYAPVALIVAGAALLTAAWFIQIP